MNIQEARTFVARFVQGKYTKEEHESFLQWVNGASMDHIEAIAGEFETLQQQVVFSGKPSATWIGQLEDRLDAVSSGRVISMHPRRNLVKAISWAAAIVLVIGAGGYFLMNKKMAQQEQSVAVAGKAILPGSDKAELILADGTTMQLNEAANGVLTEQGNSTIKKLNDRVVVYEPKTGSKNGAEVYNTIKTPRGGQYQLVLPDQTKVWLNAGSSIRFPVAFNGNERRVAINGEVYFEVAKNPKQPFRAVIAADLTPEGVNKGIGEVEVVGTHFNIMAYTNEPSIQTTLLKGSVKVVSGNHSKVLKPGQQAKIINFAVANDKLTVQDISDAEALVSWKDGYFPGTTSDVLMRQIARWYDVEVEFQGSVPEMKFEGKLPREAGIEDVLKILNANGIHTELDKPNRKIVVKQ